ncbi:MAG: cryptochrome/photolyase family protein [Ornithinimicrobium sp.]
MSIEVRLIFPHQLFVEHFDAPSGTTYLLVEDDLFFRQYAFHAQKLILHRASMQRFADTLRERGHEVREVLTDARRTSMQGLSQTLRDLSPVGISYYDVVDDWLGQRLTRVLAELELTERTELLESPNFICTRAEIEQWFAGHKARMNTFYQWQRTRLDILMDDKQPAGGQWSFDEDNRKKLPKGHTVPTVPEPARHEQVEAAIEWVQKEFPDAPGNAQSFAWPTSHAEAESAYETFLSERFAQFGPYEDAISKHHPYLFHAVLTPGLNIGLVDPRHVVERALDVAEDERTSLASVEGFVRQVIGWREYMRATYHLWGPRMRTANDLQHTRSLDAGWWSATTGLEPVDVVLRRVLDSGYAHHIERLMVFGNALCLLRIDPDEVYEWFMEMFIDAYDWVMVPNVYAMSQFAAGAAITTKPYVSGSNYLKKMSDMPPGQWREDWDGLFWTFVEDHRDVFETHYRSRMMTRLWDGFDGDTQAAHRSRAREWLG